VARKRVPISAMVQGIGTLALTILLAMAPARPAYAYIDPNSAGPLYQLLFPLIVAAASVIAGFRRLIAQLWNRLFGTRTQVGGGETDHRSDVERRT